MSERSKAAIHGIALSHGEAAENGSEPGRRRQTATNKGSASVAWAWQHQSVWSAAATNLEHGVLRWRRAALLLTVSGAALATLSATITSRAPEASRWVAWVAAVCVGVAPFAVRRTTRPYLEQWTRTRAVSECLKAEVFTYLAGAEPYTNEDRNEVLDRQVENILERADDLAVHTLGLASRQRALPAVVDLSGYLAVRVHSQVDGYYRKKALSMRLLASRIRKIELALAGAGIALLAAGSIWNSGVPGAWAPVATTIAAGVAAYGAAGRYEALPVEYARTAAELDRLAHAANPDSATPANVNTVVHTIEQVIAAENRSWMSHTLSTADDTDEQSVDGGSGLAND